MEDENGNICLNDLWEIAGRLESKKPSYWRRHNGTLKLAYTLPESIMIRNHNSKDVTLRSVLYADGRGWKARTFAHPDLALAYAKYLSPELPWSCFHKAGMPLDNGEAPIDDVQTRSIVLLDLIEVPKQFGMPRQHL